MQDDQVDAFREVIHGVYSFYGRDCSGFTFDVWWQALKGYDLAAVRDALGRHCVNPDTGQFLPKPADVVKLLAGSTLDSAVVAWTKVDRAVQHVGTYETVVFDDALIHRVIADMGGWALLGQKKIDEWPFVAKEFQTRYRGYLTRRDAFDYPRKLVGIFDRDNRQRGFDDQPAKLIGNPRLAGMVFERGSERAAIEVTELGEAAGKLLTDTAS